MTTDNNTITTLRDELFATLRAIRDPKKPLPPESARAVVQVAAVIIDSARAEVEFHKATGMESRSGFIPASQPAPAGAAAIPEASSGTTITAVPGGRILKHRMGG